MFEIAQNFVYYENMIAFVPWFISSFLIFIELFLGIFLVSLNIKRNERFGVRVKYAYSSEETWKFINRLFGIVFLIVALCQIPIVYPIYVLFLGSYFVDVTLSVCFSQVLILVLTLVILLTICKVKEKKLKEKNEDI